VKIGLGIDPRGWKLKQQKCDFKGISLDIYLRENACSMMIHRSLQIHVLEEGIQDCKKKWHNHKLYEGCPNLKVQH
jgi:hypothetical protein